MPSTIFTVTLLSAAFMILVAFDIAILSLVTRPTSRQDYVAKTSSIRVTKDEYGTTEDGRVIDRYRLTNNNGMVVELITYGGTITVIKTPDKSGALDDIILGYDSLRGYENVGNPYFGSLIGRFANRIRNAQFWLDGVLYRLNVNNANNHLHGGITGWNKAVWRATVVEDGVQLSHVSPDGDERFPGEVHVNVTYILSADNELVIKYSAVTTEKPTPINLSSHAYFNLAGEGTSNLDDHIVEIFADYYLPVDEDFCTIGEIWPVNGSTFDLLRKTRLGDVLSQKELNNGSGFDNNYCLRGPDGIKLAARVFESTTGRRMDVYTNQRGLQFYTGNFLNGILGKKGHIYGRHSGFCMEAQNYPAAINYIPKFPDCVLRPGTIYQQYTKYSFSTQL